MIKVAGGAAESILAQFYYGTLPTSMPSACASPTTSLTPGCVELTAGGTLDNNVVCDTFGLCDASMGDGMYAVLEGGSTPVTVYSCSAPN